MPTLKLANLHRGMVQTADYVTPQGGLENAENAYLDPRWGAGNRNGTQYVRNITELSSALEYEIVDIDDEFVTIGSDGAGGLEVLAFKNDGTAATIYQTATMDFTSGGTYEILLGDQVDGQISGATGIVNKIELTSGTWAGGDAAGTLTIRLTTPATPFDPEAIDVGANLNVATIESPGSTNIGFGYLGANVANIRAITIQDSVIVLNTNTTVAALDAPTGTVIGEVKDFSKLLLKTDALVGDIWKTKYAFEVNPAGHYYCYEAASGNQTSKWKRIPKPDQEDAYHDPTTLPHQLRRIAGTNDWEWERPSWKPRLSGGDEEGKDEFGNPIILNPNVLNGNKILALTFWRGRFVFALDNKVIAIGQALDYFNFWIDDIDQIKAADLITDEIIEKNTGDVLFLEGADSNLFIQMERRQGQLGTRDQALSAGGSDGPYNATLTFIGEFSASDTSRPTVAAGLAFFEDESRNIHLYRDFGQTSNYKFTFIQSPSDSVKQELKDEQIDVLRLINKTLHVITNTGEIYQWHLFGEDEGQLVGGWTKFTHNSERARWVWGHGTDVRMLVDYGNDISLLKYEDQDEVLPSGFTVPPSVDRRELVTGVYSVANDETSFTLQTTPTVADWYLVNNHTLVKLNFDAGESAIAVGDTIVNADGDASATVVRVRKYGDGLWDGDLKGFLTLARTTSVAFADNDVLKVSGVNVAVADGAEITKAPKNHHITPARVDSGNVLVFNGEWGPVSGVALTQYVGRGIDFELKFPKVWAGMNPARLLIRKVFVFHHETTNYDVTFERTGRDDKVFNFQSQRIGTVVHDQHPLDSDFYEIGGIGVGRDTTIKITKSTPGQARIVGLHLEVDPSTF